MVNAISEKGLSVNHKVKIVNFPGGTSEKILEKLDDKIKKQPDDLIVHVGTNDLTNNACLKNFCIQKGISFIDNSGIKEFHLGKRETSFEQERKQCLCKKLIASYK